MSQSRHIVILGGSYVGTALAHNILKNIPSIKITLINPSDLFYFNIAAPRVLAKPKEIDLDKVLISIPERFSHYPKGSFTFIRGTATAIDFSTKIVNVDGDRVVSYDYVVIATGSSTPATQGQEAIPYNATQGNDIRKKLQEAQSRISGAKSIIIGGAGPVGVETAGEIAEAYKDKTVTLLSSHDQVLPAMKKSAASMAETNLKNLGVKVLLSSKIPRAQFNQLSGKWVVVLADGSQLEADLYIPAMGNIPNTSFIKSEYLDADGWVTVDNHLRLPKVTDGSAYSLGDATTFKQRYLLKAQSQVPIVATNLKTAITGTGKVTTYTPDDKLMVFVPTGSKSGTGQVGKFVLWSFLVAFAKGKDYFIPKAASYVSAT